MTNETSYLDFDPVAYSELKKPPDPSEVSIFRIFRKLHISVRTKIYQEISRNDPESRTLNPKPFYWWQGYKWWSSEWLNDVMKIFRFIFIYFIFHFYFFIIYLFIYLFYILFCLFIYCPTRRHLGYLAKLRI